MFSGVENCCRIPPAERGVEARSYIGSFSTTSTDPGKWTQPLRKYATALPITPPPTMITSALANGFFPRRTPVPAVSRKGRRPAIGRRTPVIFKRRRHNDVSALTRKMFKR
jgi:hypothetical protein